MKAKGYIVWEGLSPVDKAPIAAIVTMKTSNRKTGDMAQLWIIRTDISPVAARMGKLDASICGTCPLKSGNGCYVNVGQAPLSIFRGLNRGIYSRDISECLAALSGRKIRLGAYGDPAMVPFEVLSLLVLASSGHTGYTHQWKNSFCDSRMKTILQASCDNEKMAVVASRIGWKTFRHAVKDATLLESEKVCASDANGTQCANCLGCNGSAGNYVVTRHGSTAGRITA